jgi:hypothetical protein
MLWWFLQSVSNAILLKLCQVDCQTPDEESGGGSRGFISDIPFSPLEVNATTRVAAAQADDAEVDLLAWSSPSETEEEAHARVILRRFVVRWWAYNLCREAVRWWNRNGRDPHDQAAIEDCIFPACVSSYWHWHRGSCLFFWRFPKEFQRLT